MRIIMVKPFEIKVENQIIHKQKVAVILLNYNGWKDTIECLNSLDKIQGILITTIVVDNASPHQSNVLVNEVKRRAGQFIQASHNGGFAFGNNLAIRWALNEGFNFILLLNNDTEVQPDFLEIMINNLEENSEVGVLGSRILFYDEPDKVWFNGARINWWKGTGAHYDVGELTSNVDYREVNDYITGLCVVGEG